MASIITGGCGCCNTCNACVNGAPFKYKITITNIESSPFDACQDCAAYNGEHILYFVSEGTIPGFYTCLWNSNADEDGVGCHIFPSEPKFSLTIQRAFGSDISIATVRLFMGATSNPFFDDPQFINNNFDCLGINKNWTISPLFTTQPESCNIIGGPFLDWPDIDLTIEPY